MTNSTMMTMVTPTDRAKRMLNLLKRLVKEEYLYTDEQLKNMKAQLRVVKEELARIESKTSKGFGK